jgi:uncharacterized protein (TIGR03083 family)
VTSCGPGDDIAGRSGRRIDARPPFGRVRAALTEVLAGLGAADWEQPTACAPWLVRDVVAHILGDDLARLSRSRDGHRSAGPGAGETLPAFLRRHNQQWVEAAGRVSTGLLQDLLRAVTPQVLAYWQGADLDALGEAVSWADPGPAPVWLDCARDFTEYWTHLHQILEATGQPPLDRGRRAARWRGPAGCVDHQVRAAIASIISSSVSWRESPAEMTPGRSGEYAG